MLFVSFLWGSHSEELYGVSKVQAAHAMLTPAQPQYWYEANGSPVESIGAVNGTEQPQEQALQDKEVRHAARVRRRRNQAALLTPVQPQYWYEANSPEPCTENTTNASSTPDSGCSVSVPPEAARNVSTRKRSKKAALTPAQPQYWCGLANLSMVQGCRSSHRN